VSATQGVNDEELLQLVGAWIDDLARGDYESAFARTKHDPYYGWTPALIERVIDGYGLPEPHPSGVRYAVTDRAAARGTPRLRHVDREGVRSPVIARVEHDLPLNGEWSDLTASFRVEQTVEGVKIFLEEIHVY
jgi:hypothetical protein